MRVRILTPPTGFIDGMSLDHFRVGGVYELRTQIACVFLAEGWAELAGANDPPLPDRPPPDGAAHVEPALVLVVDDDPDVRRLTESVLTERGYRVEVSMHGRDGIQRLREACPDLIVLDLDMPVMDGWQFRMEQRSLTDQARAAVPVLLLTADEEAAAHAAAMRAVGVVNKPVDPDRLVAAVFAAIVSRRSCAGGSGPERPWSRRTPRSTR